MVSGSLQNAEPITLSEPRTQVASHITSTSSDPTKIPDPLLSAAENVKSDSILEANKQLGTLIDQPNREMGKGIAVQILNTASLEKTEKQVGERFREEDKPSDL